jgi:chromosomal replication initiation ATPase DnaA
VETPTELTAESVWSDVASRLRGALNESTFHNWFGQVDGMELTDKEFVLAVPNDFTREWI